MNRKAFTLIELLVALAIIGIVASVILPLFGKRKSAWISEEPAGPPRAARRVEPVDSIRLFLSDKVMAAEVSQVLSNGGYRVQWLDSNTGSVSR